MSKNIKERIEKLLIELDEVREIADEQKNIQLSNNLTTMILTLQDHL